MRNSRLDNEIKRLGWKTSRDKSEAKNDSDSKVSSVVGGGNINVDASDSNNPIVSTTGATGSFTTVDSKTVTVNNGIITSIT